uniref:Uncharacterized protein n=1 Tax=Arundo donax TaxID=35708 RepID=A0A0A9APX6_ARUDO
MKLCRISSVFWIDTLKS